MQQQRRLHGGFHLANGPYPFGSGLDGEFSPEAAKNDARAPYTVTLGGRDEIVLKLQPPATFPRDPSLRLDPAAARRLAGALLAFAGAIDGAPSD